MTCEIKVNMSTCPFTNGGQNVGAIIRLVYCLCVRGDSRRRPWNPVHFICGFLSYHRARTLRVGYLLPVHIMRPFTVLGRTHLQNLIKTFFLDAKVIIRRLQPSGSTLFRTFHNAIFDLPRLPIVQLATIKCRY